MFLVRMLEVALDQIGALRGAILEIYSTGIFEGDGNPEKILRCIRAMDELEVLILDKRFRGVVKKVTLAEKSIDSMRP